MLQDLARILQESCKMMHSVARFLQDSCKNLQDNRPQSTRDAFHAYFLVFFSWYFFLFSGRRKRLLIQFVAFAPLHFYTLFSIMLKIFLRDFSDILSWKYCYREKTFEVQTSSLQKHLKRTSEQLVPIDVYWTTTGCLTTTV